MIAEGRAEQTAEDSWTMHMRRGDFAAAWAVSDTILRARGKAPCWHWPRHQQYVWAGRPLTGQRVLIRCYHGLGDTVQFIRYAPRVRAIAREVIAWAQPCLLPLLRSVRGIDRLLPLHDGTPEVEYDVDVESMELPHVFRSTLETLPADVPYLHVPAAHRFPGRELNVGIVWSAGDWDGRRSIPPHLLEPLRSVPGVRLHLLQRGAARFEWADATGCREGSDDILEAAAIIRGLDLVIAVDTFPAHLAGALGVPTWTLLQAEPDWRWMSGREHSPWYPTMRLFRQPAPGAWEPVAARVGRELAALAAARLPAGAMG